MGRRRRSVCTSAWTAAGPLGVAIQVYLNGREWRARQLDRRGVGCQRYDNAVLAIDDLSVAVRLCGRFGHRAWPRMLNAFARVVNPWISQDQPSRLRRLLPGHRPVRHGHGHHVP